MEKKWWIVLVVAVLVLVAGYFYLSWVPEDKLVDNPMSHCESVDDCAVDNLDCSGCSCDELFAVNRDYFGKICEGVVVEDHCLRICDIKWSVGCVENQCVVA